MLSLLGQTTQPFNPLDFTQLTTIGAIVALTITIVSVIRAKVGVGKLAEIPVWVYVGVVSTILTVLANKVFGTLGGDLPDLIYQSLLNSLLAVGIHSTGKNLGTPAGRALASVFLLMLFVGGCSQLARQETIEVREGLNDVNKQIHPYYLKWAQEKRDAGQLSDRSLESAKRLVSRHDSIVEASRKRDSQATTQPATPSIPGPR